MLFQEGLAKKIWHKSTPKAVQANVAAKDTKAIFSSWSSCLSQHAMPEEYAAAFATDEPPLLWGLPEEASTPSTVDLLRQLENLAVCAEEADLGGEAIKWPEAISDWLDKIESSGFGLIEAYEALAWTHALPALASIFVGLSDAGNKPASRDVCCKNEDVRDEYETLWWNLLETLVAIANEAEAMTKSDSPLFSMLVTAELGLTLAFLFGELEPCRELVKPARKAINEGMVELFDGEGLLEAKHFELMRSLLACWVRCEAIGQFLCDGKFLKKDPAGQLEWAIRQTMRWTRSDGSQTLCDAASGRWCKPLFDAALAFDEDDEDQDIAMMTLPGWGEKPQIETLRKYALADAASHSEWSRAAVLRPDWEQAGPRFSLLYPKADKKVAGESLGSSGGGFFIELENQRQLLLSGEWQYQIRLGNKTLEAINDWEETCWVMDDDIDYIELQQELSDGFLLQRQVALAREDTFLFLADTITGPGSDQPGAKLQYTASLPLVMDVVVDEDKESREIRLLGTKKTESGKKSKSSKSNKVSKTSSKPIATILPIGLSEWKAAGQGRLHHAADGRLELTMTGTQDGLYVPLFVDLDVKRMVKPLTWRTLTVAESLEVVEPDRAVGYRVEAGGEQWLIYRSLDLPENRTVLGENLIAETLIAQFDESGQTTPLITIQ